MPPTSQGMRSFNSWCIVALIISLQQVALDLLNPIFLTENWSPFGLFIRKPTCIATVYGDGCMPICHYILISKRISRE